MLKSGYLIKFLWEGILLVYMCSNIIQASIHFSRICIIGLVIYTVWCIYVTIGVFEGLYIALVIAIVEILVFKIKSIRIINLGLVRTRGEED